MVHDQDMHLQLNIHGQSQKIVELDICILFKISKFTEVIQWHGLHMILISKKPRKICFLVSYFLFPHDKHKLLFRPSSQNDLHCVI